MSEETIERMTQYREEERGIESELSRLEDAIAATKEELKELREEFDDNVQRLRDLVRNGPAQPTLFDQPSINHPADQPKPPHPVDPEATPGIPNDESPAIEAVKLSTPIVELGLPKGIESALLEAGLSTVGEIAAFTEQGNDLTDIKGIGEGKAERIRNAMASVWE